MNEYVTQPESVSQLPPGTPVFFLSYARLYDMSFRSSSELATGDEHLLRFYHDLCRHVRRLVGSRTGVVPGFIDQSMVGGEKWENSILTMVRHAPVFVALLSADYVESDWCAKEWDAFSRRRPRSLGGHNSMMMTTILPVIWSPLVERRIPDVVKEVQRWAPDLRAGPELRRAYASNGIYGLLVTDSEHYDAVTWHLARLVAEFYNDFEVPAGDPVTFAELENVFTVKKASGGAT